MKEKKRLKKQRNEKFGNIILKSGILAVIPILVIDITSFLLSGYSYSFLLSTIKEAVKFAIAGALLGIAYICASRRYAKLARYAAWGIVLAYYAFSLVYFSISIYFYASGPLFS